MARARMNSNMNNWNGNNRYVDGWMIGVFVFFAIIIIFCIFFPRRRWNTAVAVENFDPQYENYMEHYGGRDETEENKAALVLFYAPWCGHCTRAMPEFDRLMQKYKGNPKVKVFKVNCDEDTAAAQKNGIQGFPTIKFFPSGYGNTTDFLDYEGARTTDGLDTFIQENLNQ